MTSKPLAVTSRGGFADAVCWGLQTAAAQGARRIVCVDADFALWPLDEAELLDTMTAWLRLPQRQLLLLARRYDEVPRRFPRFTGWRRDWAHAVCAWQAPEDVAPALPTLLVTDTDVVVQLVDAVHIRGRAEQDGRRARAWREAIDVVLQRSEPAFAVSTLGL
jgi:hypothetical protein